jgi:hypothetical protein
LNKLGVSNPAIQLQEHVPGRPVNLAGFLDQLIRRRFQDNDTTSD